MSDDTKEAGTATASDSKASEAAASKKKSEKSEKAGKPEETGKLKAKMGVVATDKVEGVGFASRDTKQADAVLASIPMKDIVVKPGFNPRVRIETAELSVLADNIKKDGLINPITVRPSDKPGKFWLVAGERRYRACKLNERENIQAVIRFDLDNDADARAVAVAENSEDGRTNLSYIEMGQVFIELRDKHKWGVTRIASECGVAEHTVRRALAIMEAPSDVQKRVADGQLSAMAALEYAKMDDGTRKKIKDQLTDGITADGVRQLGKAAAKAEGAKPDTTKKSNKQKGASRDATLVAWKASKVKQAQIVELAAWLMNAEKDGESVKTDVAYVAMQGALCALLWDRGDLDTPWLPDIDSADNKKDAKAQHAAYRAALKAAAAQAKAAPEEKGDGKDGEDGKAKE